MPTEVDFLILCDAAQVAPDSKLYTLGAGLTFIGRPVATGPQAATPPTSRFALAAGFLIDWNDTNESLSVRVAIEDDDNHPLVQLQAQLVVGRPPQAPPGMEQRALLALPIMMQFPKAGAYHARATIDSHEAQRVVNFQVVDLPLPVFAPPGPPASGPPS